MKATFVVGAFECTFDSGRPYDADEVRRGLRACADAIAAFYGLTRQHYWRLQETCSEPRFGTWHHVEMKNLKEALGEFAWVG